MDVAAAPDSAWRGFTPGPYLLDRRVLAELKVQLRAEHDEAAMPNTVLQAFQLLTKKQASVPSDHIAPMDVHTLEVAT